MHCDVSLWKQLTDLNASITTLKEDFRNAALYRPKFDSFTSSSSDTDSFISAQEYTDISSISSTHNRVLSWVTQCDQGETSAHVASDTITKSRSPPHGDKNSTVNASTSRRNTLESCNIEIHNTFIKPQNTGNWNLDWQDIYSRDINPRVIVTPCTMKTIEDRDILASCSLTCYKSSLRFLGSVRMQSRIFEANLTKWRPLSLLNGIDSYIISPPAPFSNIRPRQKLHRLCNFVFNKPVEDADTNENSTNSNCEGMDKSDEEKSTNSNCEGRDKSDDEKSTNSNCEGRDKSDAENSTNSNCEGRDKSDAEKSTNSNCEGMDQSDAENSTNSNCEGRDKSDVESSECEIRETVEQADASVHVYSDNSKTETYEQLQTEYSKTRTNLKVYRSDSGYSEDFGNTSDKEIDTVQATGIEVEPFYSKYLDIKDGLITCRILHAEAEEQEVTQTSVDDEDELEFLVMVDGRVSFSPHIQVAEQEESYYLKWMFDSDESELSIDEDTGSCFTHCPPNEGNHDRNDANDSYFISRLFEEESDTETDILDNECDNSIVGEPL